MNVTDSYKTKSNTKLSTDDTDQITRKVHRIVTKIHQNNQIDKETPKYIDPIDKKIRTPQIHKAPPTSTKFIRRPTISGCSGLTQRISEYIDYFIKPIVQKQPIYIKDTTDFINKLDMIEIPEKALLVTLDVVSMYTNTLQAEAIKAVAHVFDSESALHHDYKILRPSTHYIEALLTQILQHNTF